MGRHDCSVCNCQVADIINAEFLKPRYERKMGLRELQALSGCSRSALSRHSINCVPKIRFLRNRNKKASATPTGRSRIVVLWPEQNGEPAHYESSGRILRKNELRHDDLLLAVVYEKTKLAHFGNPKALVCEQLIDEALAEDAQRFPKLLDTTVN